MGYFKRNLTMSWQWQPCCTSANLIFRFLKGSNITCPWFTFLYTCGYINGTFLWLSGPSRRNLKKAISSHFFTSSYKLLGSVLTFAHCAIIRCCSLWSFRRWPPKVTFQLPLWYFSDSCFWNVAADYVPLKIDKQSWFPSCWPNHWKLTLLIL